MKNVYDKAARAFSELHEPGKPLVLYNVWDAGSAKAVEAAGAKAIATGSYSLAGAQGAEDGEGLPFENLMQTAQQIIGAVAIPVTVDIETGYGDTPEDVGNSAKMLADIGVAGVNIEDQLIGENALRDAHDNAERIAAAAYAALFVNARTDIFIQIPPDRHDDALVDAALERAHIYAEAGAGSFFVPFLSDALLIKKIAENCPLPVNIMAMDADPDMVAFAKLGVSRISFGPKPWRDAMHYVQQSAEHYLK